MAESVDQSPHLDVLELPRELDAFGQGFVQGRLMYDQKRADCTHGKAAIREQRRRAEEGYYNTNARLAKFTDDERGEIADNVASPRGIELHPDVFIDDPETRNFIRLRPKELFDVALWHLKDLAKTQKLLEARFPEQKQEYEKHLRRAVVMGAIPEFVLKKTAKLEQYDVFVADTWHAIRTEVYPFNGYIRVNRDKRIVFMDRKVGNEGSTVPHEFTHAMAAETETVDSGLYAGIVVEDQTIEGTGVTMIESFETTGVIHTWVNEALTEMYGRRIHHAFDNSAPPVAEQSYPDEQAFFQVIATEIARREWPMNWSAAYFAEDHQVIDGLTGREHRVRMAGVMNEVLRGVGLKSISDIQRQYDKYDRKKRRQYMQSYAVLVKGLLEQTASA